MVDFQESIISIILLVMGIGISIMVLIFVSVLGGGVYTNSQTFISSLSTDITNDTSANISFSKIPYIFNASTNIDPGSETIKAWNNTKEYGTLTLGTNYTVSSYSNGQFNIIDLGGLNNSHIYLNASYTTGYPSVERNITSAIRNSFIAINTTGSYLPIIVLAVIIFIVLGLIMTLTPTTDRGYESGRMAL